MPTLVRAIAAGRWRVYETTNGTSTASQASARGVAPVGPVGTQGSVTTSLGSGSTSEGTVKSNQNRAL